MVGQFLAGTATSSEDPPRERGRGRACAEYASGSQVVEVGQALSGESVEQVGLGGADAGRGSLGACAKGTANGHASHRTGSASPTPLAAGFPCTGPQRGVGRCEKGIRWGGRSLAIAA
ncbi:hypothetical protein [Streptomyces sp. NPDC018352]|uniref:hypothetical protein n=1 Tax=Streptomyces sp. NPDC018352 TaxID=3157194 RepID=UPI0033D415F8